MHTIAMIYNNFLIGSIFMNTETKTNYYPRIIREFDDDEPMYWG
jgi:hypothetical protein